MKCLALLACEKVIIDKDGAHSIINVMLNAEISLQLIAEPGKAIPPVTVPPNALTGTMWWIYSIWEPSQDDVGKPIEQVYKVYWPSGEHLLEGRLPYALKDDSMNQTTFSIAGFPIGQQGKVKIVTWLESEGKRFTEDAETFVSVKHKF
jgi:hypothetical protein